MTGTEVRRGGGHPAYALSMADASHREASAASYSRKGENSPQPSGPRTSARARLSRSQEESPRVVDPTARAAASAPPPPLRGRMKKAGPPSPPTTGRTSRRPPPDSPEALPPLPARRPVSHRGSCPRFPRTLECPTADIRRSARIPPRHCRAIPESRWRHIRHRCQHGQGSLAKDRVGGAIRSQLDVP